MAHDYLTVMASSVSSECAFSGVGITITKCRNQLQGNIVEALQCLKALIHQDLIFREVPTAMEEEAHLDLNDEEPANQEANAYDVVQEGYNWEEDEFNVDGEGTHGDS